GVRWGEAWGGLGVGCVRGGVGLQAVAHGFSGNRTAMEAAAAQARAIGGDRDTVEMITLANGVGLYHLGEGRLPEALDAMDRAMDVLRAAGGAAGLPGRRAAPRTAPRNGGGARP